MNVALFVDRCATLHPSEGTSARSRFNGDALILRQGLILAVAYYLTGRIGLLLAIAPGYATAVWPASGMALAGVLLWGYRVWPGVLLGSFLLNVGVSWEPFSLASMIRSLSVAISIGVGSTLQALLGAFLIRRWVVSGRPFDRVRDVFRFTGIEFLNCMVAATWGVATLSLAGMMGWASGASAWWTWWLGDLIGVLLVAPLILTWSSFPRGVWTSRRVVEALVSVGLLLLITQSAFTDGLLRGGAVDSPLVFVLVPCVVWLGFRFDQRVVTLATLLMSVVALYGATRNLDAAAVTANVNTSLLGLQSFMGIASVTGLALTAALAERKRADDKFRRVVEAAPNAIVVVNGKGTIVLVNSQTETLFGYVRSELLGQPVELLFPDRFHERHPIDRANFFGDPETRSMGVGRDLCGRRNDASEFPVEIGLNPIDTEDGTLVLAAIVDITRRKQVEVELYRAHAELEQRVADRTVELIQSNQALMSEVAERNQAEADARQLLQRLVTSQEDERRHLARELHDQMGQTITAIRLSLQSMKESYPQASPVPQSVRELLEMTSQMAREVHSLAWQLRPATLDDCGLLATLQRYIEDWSERNHVPVAFQDFGFGDARLPTDLDTTLYRIIQEALTNVAKHAQARQVSLILERQANEVLVIVEDDGLGFDPDQTLKSQDHQRALGLLGIRERLKLVGGSFQIESTPNCGTTLFVRIPLPPQANNEEAAHVEMSHFAG